VSIFASKFIAGPKKAIWHIISNTEGEQKCWPSIRSIDIRIIQQKRTEREVSTIFGFKFIETIDEEPEKSIVVHIAEGPFTGIKTISLKPTDEGRNTIAEISWDIHLKVGMRMFSPLVKRYITDQTRNALEKMAAAVARKGT